MKRKILIVFILLALIAAAFFLVPRFLGEKTDGTKLYGNVDYRELALSFRQGGRIARLLKEEGDLVSSGEVLAELDTQLLAEELASAKAKLALAKSEEARVEALLEEARANYTRQKTLAKEGAVSQKELEAATSVLKQNTAQLAVAKAQIEAMGAALALAQTALADGTLHAPTDALVSVRTKEVGSMVSSQTPVYLLSLHTPVFIRAYVDETQLPKASPGKKVRIFADGLAESLAGSIAFISPRAEFTPKSVETEKLRPDLVYRIKIEVHDKEAYKHLRQGMPVTIRLDE